MWQTQGILKKKHGKAPAIAGFQRPGASRSVDTSPDAP